MRLGHRYYDASVGRFLSRDPIQDGYNWYAYCNNDPVNGVDPEGLMAWVLAAGAIAFPEIAIPVIIVIGIGGIIIGIGHAIDYFNQPNLAKRDNDDSQVRNGPAAPRIRKNTRKEAEEEARRKGGVEPVGPEDHNDGHGPHYHPGDPNNPGNDKKRHPVFGHWHYYFPKSRM